MLSSLSKLFGRKVKAEALPQLQHPKGPVIVNLETGQPKAYFEYFVNDQDLNHITFMVRAYLPRQNEDGTWGYIHKEVASPANSVATARHAAQKVGHELIGGA